MEHVWDSLWSNWATSLPERQSAIRVLQLGGQSTLPGGESAIQPLVFTLARTTSAPFVAVPAIGSDAAETDADPDDSSASITIETPSNAPTAEVAARSGMVTFAGGNAATFGAQSQLFGDPASNYAILYSEDFQSALVVNMINKTLLEGGPGNFPDLSRGDNDVLNLSGDFSDGFTLPVQPQDIDLVVLGAGQDYSLIADDDGIAPGESMTINGVALGAGNRVVFDGSGETDGSFVFLGSQAGDTFIGGDGDDVIMGLGGADSLRGGAGADTYSYLAASQSSGLNYDTLGDFDAGEDRIDLGGTIAGFGAAITGGTLSHASFNSDLGTALAGLGAAQARWFTPDAGDLAGTVFLVVDANGVAGYQEGEDYVFAFTGTPLADLTGHTDIFI